MIRPTPLDGLLKNDRLIVITGLIALVILAGTYTVSGVGMSISAIQMTRMGDAIMTRATWSGSYAILVFFMWWIMMVAMMTPSAAPMILLFSALKRRGAASRNSATLTFTFLSGYLLIWAAFSVLATGLLWSLDAMQLIADNLRVNQPLLGSTLLLCAGLYQLSAWKYACLKKCQSPIRFLVERRRPGFAGALRMGLEHGGYCLGCCWFLMLLLFVGGVMNLYWIGTLAIYILLEKVIPGGIWLGRISGAALCVAGATWAIALQN